MLFSKSTGIFKHIIVLVDGTSTSRNAVLLAVNIAKSMQAKLTAVSLVETDTLHQLLRAKILSETEMAEFKVGLNDSAKRHLAEATSIAEKNDVKLDTVVIQGNSSETLPKEIAARHADLIVIGAFKSNDAHRDLLACQRQQIVDHAACPILVAR